MIIIILGFDNFWRAFNWLDAAIYKSLFTENTVASTEKTQQRKDKYNEGEQQQSPGSS